MPTANVQYPVCNGQRYGPFRVSPIYQQQQMGNHLAVGPVCLLNTRIVQRPLPEKPLITDTTPELPFSETR